MGTPQSLFYNSKFVSSIHFIFSIQEKIGVNLGFVGCIQSLTAGHMDLAEVYNLEYPSPSSQVLDGLDIGKNSNSPCEKIKQVSVNREYDVNVL